MKGLLRSYTLKLPHIYRFSQIVFFLIVGFSLLGTVNIVSAESTLDQHYSGAPENYNKLRESGSYIELYQQFTVGINGPLSSVKLNLQKNGNPIGSVSASIYTDYNNSPYQGLVTPNYISASSITNGWNTFTFSSPYTVSQGQVLWIGLSGDYSISATDNIGMAYSSGTPVYSGGIKCIRNDLGGYGCDSSKDYNFETYVGNPSFTGCLNSSSHTLYNVAQGTFPSSTCNTGDPQVSADYGDITSVTAGGGLTGGSSLGAATW